jgi:hypothetical protein
MSNSNPIPNNPYLEPFFQYASIRRFIGNRKKFFVDTTLEWNVVPQTFPHILDGLNTNVAFPAKQPPP